MFYNNFSIFILFKRYFLILDLITDCHPVAQCDTLFCLMFTVKMQDIRILNTPVPARNNMLIHKWQWFIFSYVGNVVLLLYSLLKKKEVKSGKLIFTSWLVIVYDFSQCCIIWFNFTFYFILFPLLLYKTMRETQVNVARYMLLATEM